MAFWQLIPYRETGEILHHFRHSWILSGGDREGDSKITLIFQHWQAKLHIEQVYCSKG